MTTFLLLPPSGYSIRGTENWISKNNRMIGEVMVFFVKPVLLELEYSGN